jgi:GNAT superfamily N-acetyltransferase
MNDVGARQSPFAAQLVVRALQINDIAAVRRLEFRSVRALAAYDLTDEELSGYEHWTNSHAYMAGRHDATERGELLGAFHDERLIGSAEWKRSTTAHLTAQLRSLHTDPLFTKCGVARHLLQEIENQARLAGFAEIAARTVLGAVGFFEKQGYAISTRGQINLDGDFSAAVAFMRKRLTP